LSDDAPLLTIEEQRDLEMLMKKIQTAGVVLFVGAGVSIPSGAPKADDLAQEMCAAFAPDLPVNGGLFNTMDRLQSRKGIDRVDLDDWIVKRFSPLQPSAHHRVIPKFSWPAIFTTNYDRLIEKADDSAESPA
jgi:NAD-dependent SIR2 family protein deacetylase